MREKIDAIIAAAGDDPHDRLPLPERLKRYGLGLASASCRLLVSPRDEGELALAIALSARSSRMLGLNDLVLSRRDEGMPPFPLNLASAVGDFADAAEKSDHLEEFGSIARRASADILACAVAEAKRRGLDPEEVVSEKFRSEAPKLP